MNKKLLLFIGSGLGIYLAITVISFSLFSAFVFSQSSEDSVSDDAVVKTQDGKTVFDNSLPKTEECPLNGVKYSKPQKKWWEEHRPLGVMIENMVDARPQSGVQSADVVYEAVAEGGITRFLAIFYCQDVGQIGPVRSARTYFLDFLSEYGPNPLYAHVGGANTSGPADALGQIESYGWKFYNDLDQFGVPYPVYKKIDAINGREVATEHTMFSDTSALWEYARTKRKLSNKDEDGNVWTEDFVEYSFKEDADLVGRSESQTINFEFWDRYNDFSVEWVYDKQTNDYKRKNGGDDHTDRNTKKPISAKNIVVLFMRESRANDGYEGNLHMLYGTKGTGKVIVFMDGKRIDGTWSKKDREARLRLTTSQGKEIEFNRGLLWFEILPVGNVVTVK